MANALKRSWVTPLLAPDSAGELVEVDPRVIQDHRVGQLPCPSNPPPPDGWRYWRGHEAIPRELGELANTVLHDSKQYPMGAFIQTFHEGELVGARVEWHDLQGASNTKGCFRGVNLMRQV